MAACLSSPGLVLPGPAAPATGSGPFPIAQWPGSWVPGLGREDRVLAKRWGLVPLVSVPSGLQGDTQASTSSPWAQFPHPGQGQPHGDPDKTGRGLRPREATLPGTHRHSAINRKVCGEGQAQGLPPGEPEPPPDEKLLGVAGKSLESWGPREEALTQGPRTSGPGTWDGGILSPGGPGLFHHPRPFSVPRIPKPL